MTRMVAWKEHKETRFLEKVSLDASSILASPHGANKRSGSAEPSTLAYCHRLASRPSCNIFAKMNDTD